MNRFYTSSYTRIALFLWILIPTPLCLGYVVTDKVVEKGPYTRTITLTFSLEPEEHLYKDSIHISVNSPAITLSTVRPSTSALTLFDKSFKAEKEVYTDRVLFSVDAQYDSTKPLHDALLFVPFMVSSVKEPQQITVPLKFAPPKPASIQPTSPSPRVNPLETKHPSYEQAPPQTSFFEGITSWIHKVGASIKGFLSSLFSSTGSPFVRAGAAFLLGLLLSLTPCIYPMIPITIGILQASGSTSPFRNFLLALSYTLGISTIFALFGFLAAMGGPAFGELQGNPFFVIPVAALFFYFGLTMFDIVQFPTLTFLQPKKGKVQGGSFSSAYMFGAVSGTVASPCLSPGLVLILHYVASNATGSFLGYLEGLLLLFIFGIGSSTPLLIIGTFSGSLKLLPKSGMWMVEIKKLIGVMLISMALYHLSYLERLLPWYILAWIAAAVYATLGAYYLIKSSSTESRWMNGYRTLLGTILFVIAGLFVVQGQKALYDFWYPAVKQEEQWAHNYQEAFEKAKAEGKLLFVDIGASYCSACKLLHARIFSKQPIIDTLKRFIAVEIESDIHTDSYKAVRSSYSSYIEGFPTYLIIDPKTGKVLKDWSIELEELGSDKVKAELEAIADSYTGSQENPHK